MVDESPPRRYRAFSDMSRTREPHMSNEVYKATVTAYNHNKSMGFLNIQLEAGSKLPVDITDFISKSDPSYGKQFKIGDILENPVNVNVFLHARVLEDAGYYMGPTEGDILEVKFTRREKGLTVTWVKGENNETAPHVENEPRPLNKHLPMVKGIVTNVNVSRKFAFMRTYQPCSVPKDSEAVEDAEVSENENSEAPNEKPFDVYVNLAMTKKAGYDELQEGDEIEFKYWTFNSGKSSAVHIKRKPENRANTSSNDVDSESKAA